MVCYFVAPLSSHLLEKPRGYTKKQNIVLNRCISRKKGGRGLYTVNHDDNIVKDVIKGKKEDYDGQSARLIPCEEYEIQN